MRKEIPFIISIISTLILVLILYRNILDLVSLEFIKQFLIVISLTPLSSCIVVTIFKGKEYK